jgi:hypothetical protein
MPNKPMAFFHQDGLPSAWKFASLYAGVDGHIATLPEIIDARMGTKPGRLPWERYFTTATAEYFGRSRYGAYILIVAHGVGPMSTLDGILQAYSHEFKDKTRHNRGGRISQQQFWDLEAGKFGEVSVVPLHRLTRRYEYPFDARLRADQALDNPLLLARMGPRAKEFIARYKEIAKSWHQEQYQVDPENNYGFSEPDHERFLARRRHTHLVDRWNPYIIFCEGASNCSYGYIRDGRFQTRLEADEVYAHLISISSLQHMHHDGHESLVTDVGCHEWWNGVRLVGVPQGARMSSLREGPESMLALVKKHWAKLLQPVPEPVSPGMRRLIRVGDKFFTEYPKRGATMDTGEPEYRVVEKEKIGLPVPFETEIGGYEVFYRYDISEVRAIAPPGANAYESVGEVEIVYEAGSPKRHRVKLQFYRVTVDASARVRRPDDLAKDYETIMSVLA